MEKPKPTQNLEQKRKTPEDYAVATFHADADSDITTSPLTVIRSGQDGKGVRYDGGWIPGDMLCVCKEGAGSIELFVKVHKLIKVYGEHVYEECVPITKIVSLKKLQSREANKGFNESYIQKLYGKSTEEMIEEAKQIWQQKHPDSRRIESLAPGVGSDSGAETSSNSLDVEDTSDHEKSLADKVSLAMGGVAANSAGTKKPADLVTTEPVEKPVEADKASADLVDLPAAKSVENPVVEKSMETNEANADMLPEDFKAAINEFKRLTKDNNNQFAGVARSLTGSLSEFRESITRTPMTIKDPRITEFTTNASLRISKLEASRVEILNSFIDEGFSKEMFVDSKKDPANVTGILVRKLADLGEILRGGVYAGYSGRDSLVQAIDEIIVDLSTVSGDRWDILDAVNKIKSVWGDDKS